MRRLIAIILLTASGSTAHVGDVVYVVYELPTSQLPDLQDGTLADWEDVLPDASLTHNDLSGFLFGPPDASDIAFRIFLAWHQQSSRFYIAFERIDDIYSPGSSEFFSIMLDADHSGGPYNSFSGQTETEAKRESYAHAQRYGTWGGPTEGDRVNGRTIIAFGPASGWASLPPHTEYGGFTVSDVPHHTGLEFSVTAWDDLHFEGADLSQRARLEPDSIIGLQFRISDFDGDQNELSDQLLIAGDSEKGESLHSANGFADAWLVPCGVEDCSQSPRTAVQRQSWGRIKAALLLP